MRSALIGVATIAAVLAAAAQSSSAQESFFNERFCVSGGEDDVLDCSYRTWQQCVASARGLTNVCVENPWWHGPRGQPKTQGKSRRRSYKQALLHGMTRALRRAAQTITT